MAASKEVGKKADSNDDLRKTTTALQRHCTVNMALREFTVQTEVELFKQMGDTAQAAAYMVASVGCYISQTRFS